MEEGAAKHCVYVLLTKIVQFSKTGGVVVGPEGIETMPTLPGNVDPRKEMGVDFTVMRPGHPNPNCRWPNRRTVRSAQHRCTVRQCRI